MTMQEHVKRVREALKYASSRSPWQTEGSYCKSWFESLDAIERELAKSVATNSPQASGESQAQTASLKQQAEPSDAKERGDNYLRKLAEETQYKLDEMDTMDISWEQLERLSFDCIRTAIQRAHNLGKDSK